jgi:crotonobetainyl-CoA:carnitine CoA-transferase CaiB-like acyl-CoA transferase
VRVLDLTRVIAGPVAGRVLSSYGADVLSIAAAHLPQVLPVFIDTGFGKRSGLVDLRTPEGRDRLAALVAGADVFISSYRPGALAAFGFGPEQLAQLRPGLVTVSVDAYGPVGPWAGRRGFDSLVQMATGIAADGMTAFADERPHPLPCQALDHGTGWLAAFGAVAGLIRRASVGGGSDVHVGLATTAGWLRRLGAVDARSVVMPGLDDVADLAFTMPSTYGSVRAVRPPGTVEGAPPTWSTPPPAFGADAPAWR